MAGVVHAFDIEPDLVAETERKAREAGLSNVRPEARDVVSDGTGLDAGSAGYALLFNILHIENPVGLLKEAFRILAPGGKVGVIHWRRDLETPRGPSMAIRPSAEQCRAWGEQAGFTCERFQELCCCSWHWGLVLRKPAA